MYLPDQPVKRWVSPIRKFLHIEASGGLCLLACTIVALVLANSPWGDAYHHFWETQVRLTIGTWKIGGDLGHFVINDALMAIFFFVVGLEIKREIVDGELKEWRAALLPAIAALGGMVAPMSIYLAFQYGQPGEKGWAIPMATDIAFVVGVMSLLGRRVPFSLKVMLLSLAIVDDLGAILIIAIFFSKGLSLFWLMIAVAGLLVCVLMNKGGIRSIPLYVLVGSVIWYAVYKTGIHPTVAGVALGFLTPTNAWVGENTLLGILTGVQDRLQREVNSPLNDKELRTDLQQLQFAAREAIPPLRRLEEGLHPWVAFGIMPLFALANAGVVVAASGFRDPVAFATAAGLFIGKPLGIVLFCWIASSIGIVKLPKGVTWTMLAGGGMLAGIGFTMSLFLVGLSFPPLPDGENPHAAAAKLGVLIGSAMSAIVGASLLIYASRRQQYV
jgi:NhaA family Na+:H+ antiporter